VSGRGAFPVMEPTVERQVPPQKHLDLLTVTFDKVKNSIGLSIIEALVSNVCMYLMLAIPLSCGSCIALPPYIAVFEHACLILITFGRNVADIVVVAWRSGSVVGLDQRS